MSLDCADRYNPAVSCGDLLERIHDRFTPGEEKVVPFAELRGIAKRAIDRGALTPPQFTYSAEEILRRMEHAKRMEKQRLARIANPPPAKPHGNTGKKRPDLKRKYAATYTPEARALNSQRIKAALRNRKD